MVNQSDVLGALLGHDIKERATTPNPNSTRWRESFLKIGAFRKRSERLEVRRKEFEVEESYTAPHRPHRVRKMDAIPQQELDHLEEYIAFADAQLDQDPSPRLEEEDSSLVSLEEDSPIEFRAMPPIGLSPRTHSRKWRPAWKSSGRRIQCRNRFWSEMRRMIHEVKGAPGSVRRFTNPEYKNWNWRPLYYVEDVTTDNNNTSQLPDPSASVLDFLDQYYQITQSKKSTPRFREYKGYRKLGLSHWELIQELSEEIRRDEFKFDWERVSHFRAKLYDWNRYRRKRLKDEVRTRDVVEVFGNLQPIKERYKAEVLNSSFRMTENDEIDDT